MRKEKSSLRTKRRKKKGGEATVTRRGRIIKSYSEKEEQVEQ